MPLWARPPIVCPVLNMRTPDLPRQVGTLAALDRRLPYDLGNQVGLLRARSRLRYDKPHSSTGLSATVPFRDPPRREAYLCAIPSDESPRPLTPEEGAGWGPSVPLEQDHTVQVKRSSGHLVEPAFHESGGINSS